VTTNIPFLRALASHPAFIAAQVETGFIPVCSFFSQPRTSSDEN